MKIAIISTNYQSLPPEEGVYAPLAITSQLADGLTRKGHEVTLFAGSDSISDAKLISGNLPSIKKNKKWREPFKKLNDMIDDPQFGEKAVKYREVLRGNYELLLAAELFKRADSFDIIQTHSPARIVQMSSFTDTPVAVTFHNPFDYPMKTGATKVIYEELSKRNKNIYFLSLSDSQKELAPNLPFVSTVYNGIDTTEFTPSPKKKDYLLFVGRIIPRKGAHIAIRVAKKTDKKLKMVGPTYKGREKYWKENIKPHLNEKITYEGFLPQEELIPLYQKAKALLMPITGDESFGLVMIEAMACGTPVIGFNKSSVPEIIVSGKSGFVVEDEEEMVGAVKKIESIDPKNCRKVVEDKFTVSKMVERYEQAYQKIIKLHKNKNRNEVSE